MDNIDLPKGVIEEKYNECLRDLDILKPSEWARVHSIITAISSVSHFASYLKDSGNNHHVIRFIVYRLLIGRLNPYLWQSNHDINVVEVLKEYRKYFKYHLRENKLNIVIEVLLKDTTPTVLWVVSKKSYSLKELKNELK